MNNQECLERAMLAASESYSHMKRIFDDCGSTESRKREDVLILNAEDLMSMEAA